MKTMNKLSKYLDKEIPLQVIEYNDSGKPDRVRHVIPHDDLVNLIINNEKCIKNGVSYHSIDIPLGERMHFAVRCVITDKSGRRVEGLGESLANTLKTEIAKDYPYLMANKRAFDAAAIAFLGFDSKVYSDAQIMVDPVFSLIEGGKSDAAASDDHSEPEEGAPAASVKKGRKSKDTKKPESAADDAKANNNPAEADTPPADNIGESENHKTQGAAPKVDIAQPQDGKPATSGTVDIGSMLSPASKLKASSQDAADGSKAESGESEADPADSPGSSAEDTQAADTSVSSRDNTPEEEESGSHEQQAAPADWLKTRLGEFKDPADPYSLVVKFGKYKMNGWTIRQLAERDVLSVVWLANMKPRTEKGEEVKLVATMWLEEFGDQTADEDGGNEEGAVA